MSVNKIMFPFINRNDRQIIEIINYCVLSSVICFVGALANVINLIVFYKQGLKRATNVSLFALALSDLGVVITQQMLNIFVNPLFESCDVPIATSEFQYILAGMPRGCFARTTCLITVYITAERCFCVTFPLHVKRIFTPKTATVILTSIFCLMILSVSPIYWTTFIGWRFQEDKNKTLLGLIRTNLSNSVDGMVYIIHASIAITSFLLVIAFTLIILRHLKQKGSWRKEVHFGHRRSEAVTSRDRKAMHMVVVIAAMFIFCNIPPVLLFTATFCEPEFNITGKYVDLFFVGWSFEYIFGATNSSSNVFLYLTMSSNYRRTFCSLFNCLRLQTTNSLPS